jgi:predicted DNA-binding protein
MTEHIVRLPDEIYEKVKAVAGDTGQSPDELILSALVQHLEDLEDLRAIDEYERKRKEGTLETVSIEQVSRELGLDR